VDHLILQILQPRPGLKGAQHQTSAGKYDRHNRPACPKERKAHRTNH